MARSTTRRGKRVLVIDFTHTKKEGSQGRYRRDAQVQTAAAARTQEAARKMGATLYGDPEILCGPDGKPFKPIEPTEAVKPAEEPTFAEGVKRYLTEYGPSALSPSTLYSYANRLSVWWLRGPARRACRAARIRRDGAAQRARPRPRRAQARRARQSCDDAEVRGGRRGESRGGGRCSRAQLRGSAWRTRRKPSPRRSARPGACVGSVRRVGRRGSAAGFCDENVQATAWERPRSRRSEQGPRHRDFSVITFAQGCSVESPGLCPVGQDGSSNWTSPRARAVRSRGIPRGRGLASSLLMVPCRGQRPPHPMVTA